MAVLFPEALRIPLESGKPEYSTNPEWSATVIHFANSGEVFLREEAAVFREWQAERLSELGAVLILNGFCSTRLNLVVVFVFKVEITSTGGRFVSSSGSAVPEILV